MHENNLTNDNEIMEMYEQNKIGMRKTDAAHKITGQKLENNWVMR